MYLESNLPSVDLPWRHVYEAKGLFRPSSPISLLRGFQFLASAIAGIVESRVFYTPTVASFDNPSVCNALVRTDTSHHKFLVCLSHWKS